MKTKNKFRYIAIIMALLLIVITVNPTRSLAASPVKVNLRSTETFAVLAGSTITNTGTTVINGDAGANIGLSPGTAITGQASMAVSGGSFYLGDATALQAKIDLGKAYDDASDPLRGAATTIPSELGGSTLTPGIYNSADGEFHITGTLTLDAQGDPEGVFIFLAASTLITADNSRVEFTNQARYCRTFWKVGSSATLGTNSTFRGHIFALTAITVETGAFIQGQLLAINGAVTLDNNTITNGICAEVLVPTPTVAPILTPTTPILTPVITPTSTPVSTPILTPVITPVPTPTGIPTVTPSVPTPTPTSIPVSTAAPTPTSIPTVTPSVSTPTTPTPTQTPLITEIPVVTPLPDEVIPEVDTPKTGSFPTEVLFGLGTLLTGTVLYRKKKKQ